MPDNQEQEKRPVNLGDSIPSMAKEAGHFWPTVWDHPANSELKSLRKNPNVLNPGDEVFIPEIEIVEKAKATDQKHKFKLKGEKVKYKLRLMRLGEPRKNEKYTLLLDSGQSIEGTTDGDGNLEQEIPAETKSARLLLEGGKEEKFLRIGHLNPITEISGIQQRLNNLGYQAGPEDGAMNDQLRKALSAFQGRYGLKQTGEPDEATRAKLEAIHP